MTRHRTLFNNNTKEEDDRKIPIAEREREREKEGESKRQREQDVHVVNDIICDLTG